RGRRRATLFPYTTLFRSQADLAGAADVGAAAQLDRLAHLHHAHPVAVLLAEERDRAGVQRLLHAHLADLDAVVGADLVVDPALRSEEHTSELQSRENLVC